MRSASTCPVHGLGFGALRTAAVAVLVLAAALAAHGQDDVTFIPVAPPAGAELSYDIPLEPWLIPDVMELEMQFADGLAAEFSRIAETQTGEDLTTLVGAGRDLEAAGVRVQEAMAAMSAIDVTFGIDGIARILPAESAIRDTFFGFVVWHETSRMDAKPAISLFEDLANKVEAGTQAAGDLADELASTQEMLSEAVEDEDSNRIAELAPAIVQTAQRIDAVCTSMAGVGAEMIGVVAQFSENTGSPWKEGWADVTAAVESTMTPAQTSRSALASVSDVLTLLVVLGDELNIALSTVGSFQTAGEMSGPGFIPWTVLKSDWETVDELEALIDWHEGAASEEHEGHGHAETHSNASLALADESKQAIRMLFPYKVEAAAILAKAAVEHSSTRVARARDLLEGKHLRDRNFSTELSERRQRAVLEQVDEALRENLEFAAANISARGARVAHERGADAQTAGAVVEALYWYHNTWLHSLNGGASAERVIAATQPG